MNASILEVYSVLNSACLFIKMNYETHDKSSILIHIIQCYHFVRFADEDEEVDMITPKKKGGGCG